MPGEAGLTFRTCSVCERDGAVPCEDCGKAVCELHAAGFRWAEAHLDETPPALCSVCETTRLLDDERAQREEAEAEQIIAVDGPTHASPAVQMLWWARHVWPDVSRDDTGVTVGLRTRELDVELDLVKAKVVTLLGRMGLAGLPDTGVAPKLSAILNDADIHPQGEVPVPRRFFAGYTSERGHILLPLPGRLDGAPRVHGAVLTPETILWGQFSLDRVAGASPVGGFEERPGHGGLSIALLAALARLVPEQLLG